MPLVSFTSSRTPNSFGQVRVGDTLSDAKLADPSLTLISELDDILKIPENASLSLLDATLKRSMDFCASYHGAWLTHGLLRCPILTLGTHRTVFTKPFATRACMRIHS
jgi:hypothetical protein